MNLSGPVKAQARRPVDRELATPGASPTTGLSPLELTGDNFRYPLVVIWSILCYVLALPLPCVLSVSPTLIAEQRSGGIIARGDRLSNA
jgi:hypothetical protein